MSLSSSSDLHLFDSFEPVAVKSCSLFPKRQAHPNSTTLQFPNLTSLAHGPTLSTLCHGRPQVRVKMCVSDQCFWRCILTNHCYQVTKTHKEEVLSHVSVPVLSMALKFDGVISSPLGNWNLIAHWNHLGNVKILMPGSYPQRFQVVARATGF